MKIALINHIYLETELSATTQRQILRALNAVGHPTQLIVPSVQSTTAAPTGLVHQLRTWSQHPAVSLPMFNLKMVTRLASMISRNSPDVVIIDHCSVPGALPFILLSSVSPRFPRFVLDVRSQPVESTGVVGRLRELEYLASLALCARILPGVTFLTDSMGRHELRRVGSARTFGVWESGVDREVFARERWQDKAARLRKELGLEERFIVLYHGDVSPNRGLETAVRAFEQLGSVGDDSVPVLVVLGDGSARTTLERLVEALDAPVRFLGRVPYSDVPGYVAMSDVALMAFPDHKDWRFQHPLKFAECLALEVPVIASCIPAFTAAAGDSPAVIYLSDVTPEAIADKVRYCMAHRDQLAQCGRAGRALAEAYGWDRVASRLVSYLSRL